MKDAFEREAEDLSRAGLIAPERRIDVARYLRARDRLSRVAFQQAAPRPTPSLKEHGQLVDNCCEIGRVLPELEPLGTVEAFQREYGALRDAVSQLDRMANDARARLEGVQQALDALLRQSAVAASAFASLQAAVNPPERGEAAMRPRR